MFCSFMWTKTRFIQSKTKCFTIKILLGDNLKQAAKDSLVRSLSHTLDAEMSENK